MYSGNIWGLWHKRQAVPAGISNYIPLKILWDAITYTLTEITTSGAKVLIIIFLWSWKYKSAKNCVVFLIPTSIWISIQQRTHKIRNSYGQTYKNTCKFTKEKPLVGLMEEIYGHQMVIPFSIYHYAKFNHICGKWNTRYRKRGSGWLK